MDPSSGSLTAGNPFSGALASFQDPNDNATPAVANRLAVPADSPRDTFTATVDWGDGVSTAGQVTDSNGTYYVSGNHTYSVPGTFIVTVVITDEYGSKTTVKNAVTVADAAIVPSPTPFRAIQGVGFNQSIATFTDANSAIPAANFSATIDWGDGSTTAGVISTLAAGAGFEVNGRTSIRLPRRSTQL